MKFFRYMSYLLRHKYYVFIECVKFGIPWLGVIHDWSKFLPSEFIPYMNYFYGDKSKEIRDKDGYYKPHNTGDNSFEFAWLLHQKRNKHHWQFWVLTQDTDPTIIFEMPMKYRKEMLADWKGAGKAQGANNTKGWYLKHCHRIMLETNTREWVEEQLCV